AKVWTVQFEPIDNPDGTNPDDSVNLGDSLGVGASSEITFNFNNLPSGANLFGVAGTTDIGIVVIGEHPDLVQSGKHACEKTKQSDTNHTSQGGTGATIGDHNHSIDASEGACLTSADHPDPAKHAPSLK